MGIEGSSALAKALQSPRIRWAIYLFLGFFVVQMTLNDVLPELVGGVRTVKDFDVFYVAGQLFLEGRLADAYHSDAVKAALSNFIGEEVFLPWTYPLHYNLLTALLAIIPVWVSYALFVSLSTVAYLIILRRLAQGSDLLVLVALFPAISLCVRTGQNGLMLGALLASFILLMLAGRAVAWLPLSLLTVKPHLIAGVGLYLLLKGQWRLLALAGGFAAILLAIVTLLAGPDIWWHFRQAVQDASGFLYRGLYKLNRMTSVYTTLASMGVSEAVAMGGQIVVAASWVVALGFALRCHWDTRHTLALAVFCGFFLSPYSYDYDLPVLGVGLALLAPDVLRKASAREILLILVCGWAVVIPQWAISSLPSIDAFLLTVMCVVSLRAARRSELDSATDPNCLAPGSEARHQTGSSVP